MPTPSTRTPVRIARGSYSNLNGSVSDLQDGEISYAEDQDKLYIKEGGSLVALTSPTNNPVFTGNATFDTNTLYVDGTNNRVGIGTTSPTSIFHVAGAGAPQIKVQDTDTAGGYAHFKVNNAALYIESFDEDGTEGEIIFENAASEAMRLDASGRLLLGTTTEGYARADNLTVYENGDCGITIRSSSSGYGNINFSRGTSGSDEYKGDIEYHHGTDTLSFRSAATVGLTLDSAQRVLIGETAAITTASNRLLQVVGDTNGGGVIAIGRNDTTLTNESLGGIEFYGNDTGSGFQRAASIMCEAAAEWTSNDYPTKIIFKTTPDGSSTNTLALTLDSSQNATFAGTVSDSKGNLRSIPKNTKASAYVAVASDAGQVIFISSGGVTINNNVFATADAVTIVNNSTSDQTITQGSGLLMHNAADGSSGNRTLAARGMATIWFHIAAECYISGAGLS